MARLTGQNLGAVRASVPQWWWRPCISATFFGYFSHYGGDFSSKQPGNADTRPPSFIQPGGGESTTRQMLSEKTSPACGDKRLDDVCPDPPDITARRLHCLAERYRAWEINQATALVSANCCYYYYYYRLLRHKGSTQKTRTKNWNHKTWKH